MLSVRDMEQRDVDLVARYFVEADEAFLKGMGVDRGKVPPLKTWRDLLGGFLDCPLEECSAHFVIWERNGEAVGHSNVNQTVLGERANMHLHLWQADDRRSGLGSAFLPATLDRYFETFRLERIVCEPYARNPAPNRTLPALGFESSGTLVTVPGWLNFEQRVNTYILHRDRWQVWKRERGAYVRPADEADFEEILALAREVEPLFGPMADEPGFREGMRTAMAEGMILCVSEAGTGGLLGAVAVDPEANELAWLAVFSRFRGRGLGSLLIRGAFALLDATRPAGVVTFGPEVPEGAAARAVYLRQGFADVEQGGNNPAGYPTVLMQRPAGGPAS